MFSPALLYFYYPKLNPWVLLVYILLGDDLRALVIVADSLCVLQAVQDALETVVKIVRHRCEIHADIKLKRPIDVEVAKAAGNMPIERLLV